MGEQNETLLQMLQNCDKNSALTMQDLCSDIFLTKLDPTNPQTGCYVSVAQVGTGG